MSVRARLRAVFASKGFRGASALAGSAVIAQAITLLATPVLSRIYPPEAFGYLTLVVSVAGIITPVVALRLESAVLLPSRRQEATAILVLGLMCVALIAGLSVVTLEVLFAFGLLAEMAALPGFSWWVGGIAALSGIFILLGQFALRRHRYKAVGLRNVTQSTLTAVSQLGFAAISVSPLGLVAGHALGRVGGVIPLLRSTRHDAARFSRADLRTVASEYQRFPLLFAPATLLNASALALPLICAGLWFDVADAGQWGMAERILALPIVVVAAALGQVVEARLAQNARESRVGSAHYYMRVSGVLLAFGIVVGIVAILAAPVVVPFFLGAAWHDAAVIVQLLVPMLVTRIVASPMSKALVVAQWAGVNFWLDLGRAALVVGVLLICRSLGVSLEGLVTSTALVFGVVYAATWIVGLAAARSLDQRARRSSAAV